MGGGAKFKCLIECDFFLVCVCVCVCTCVSHGGGGECVVA